MSWESKLLEKYSYTMSENFQSRLRAKNLNNGLYLLGQTTFNPYLDKDFYWIKVGFTKNPKQRFGGYRTHNPCIFYVDWLETKDSHLEFDCHSALHLLCEENLGTEWFRITKENYLRICEYGFLEIDALTQILLSTHILKTNNIDIQKEQRENIKKQVKVQTAWNEVEHLISAAYYPSNNNVREKLLSLAHYICDNIIAN